MPDVVCDIYFDGRKPCFGGVMALDGRTGATLWTTWTRHEVFAITCQEDLNKDNVTDCVAGGRAGVRIFFSNLLLCIRNLFGSLHFESSVQGNFMKPYI